MKPARVKVRTYRQSGSIYTRPDGQNTLTLQSASTDDAPREPLIRPVTGLGLIGYICYHKNVIFLINSKMKFSDRSTANVTSIFDYVDVIFVIIGIIFCNVSHCSGGDSGGHCWMENRGADEPGDIYVGVKSWWWYWYYSFCLSLCFHWWCWFHCKYQFQYFCSSIWLY